MKNIIVIALILMASLDLSGKNLAINIDGAKFKSDGDIVNWQLSYSFPDSSLKLLKNGDYWEGKMDINAKILDNVSTIADESWNLPYISVTKPEGMQAFLYGVKNFRLKPGQYKVALRFTDANDTSSKAEILFNIILQPVNPRKLDMSDVQLAHVIEADSSKTREWNSMFLRNNLYIIPNPTAEVFEEDPSLKLYYEIYNADKFAADGPEIEYSIYDALKKEVVTIPRKIKQTGEVTADYVALPLHSLQTGVYYLKVSVRGKSNEFTDTTYRTKKFYLYNTIPPQLEPKFTENEQFELSEFSTMPEERLMTEYKMAKIIAERDEIYAFERLSTLKAKQRFMFKFWKIRDKDTNTTANEMRDEFNRRLAYANTYYDYNGKKEAWKTDRGKILLKYGQPTQREVHDAFGTYKAYEEWMYADIQGGAFFYFVDSQGIGNYQLVHSTAIGELKCPDWYNQYVRKFNYEQSEEDSNQPKLLKQNTTNSNYK